MVTEQTIMEAYLLLIKNNNTIPDETLNFMLNASLEKIMALEEEKEWQKFKQEQLARLNIVLGERPNK